MVAWQRLFVPPASRQTEAEPLDLDEVRGTMSDATATTRELRGLVTELDRSFESFAQDLVYLGLGEESLVGLQI